MFNKMKRINNKKCCTKLNNLLLFVLVCVVIYGCSDNVTFTWSNGRGTPVIAGFIDDSLVVVTDCRQWLEVTETWNGGYSEDMSCGHDKMYVYNYRVQEDGPRWSDSISNMGGGYQWYQMTDSIFWRWNGESLFLWKVGGLVREKFLKKSTEKCSSKFQIKSIKQWLDGTFIAKNENSFSYSGDSCQYAILDTNAKTLTYKRLDDDLKWMEKCDDVRAWGESVYCVILDREEGNSTILKNNLDTIPTPRKFAIGGFWGNMLKLSGQLCTFNKDVINCIDITWYGDLQFYQDDEIIVKIE